MSSGTITSSRSKHPMSEVTAKLVEGVREEEEDALEMPLAKTKICFRAASRKQMDLPSLHG